MPDDATIELERFIELLNEDLASEFQSIVQYVNHIATISGAEYLGMIEELKVHLGQELAHAQALAQQVSFLGGEPGTEVPPVERARRGESEVALKADLNLETTQLERYRERFAQANALKLADVAEALRPLLEQTQEHVQDLMTALGR